MHHTRTCHAMQKTRKTHKNAHKNRKLNTQNTQLDKRQPKYARDDNRHMAEVNAVGRTHLQQTIHQHKYQPFTKNTQKCTQKNGHKIRKLKTENTQHDKRQPKYASVAIIHHIKTNESRCA